MKSIMVICKVEGGTRQNVFSIPAKPQNVSDRGWELILMGAAEGRKRSVGTFVIIHLHNIKIPLLVARDEKKSEELFRRNQAEPKLSSFC